MRMTLACNLYWSLILVSALSLAGDCATQTLDNYVKDGFTCDIRTRTFSEFKATHLLNLTADKITVTPINEADGAGLKFTGPFKSANNLTLGFGVKYLVKSDKSVEDIHLRVNGIANNGQPPGAPILGTVFNLLLKYDLGDTKTNNTADTLQLFLVTPVKVTSKKIRADFGGVGKVRVLDESAFVLSGAAGNAVESIEHRFTPNPKP